MTTNTEQLIDELQAHPVDAWEEVIGKLPDYDPEMTDILDPNYAGLSFALTDGRVFRYEASQQRWDLAEMTKDVR